MSNAPSKDKLWVFDTQHYLEIYAPTIEKAMEEAVEISASTGVEFVLVRDWETYQEEHQNGCR